jgi:histone methylation protein DOT1
MFGKGQGYKTRLLNPHDEYWDRRIGVRTFGFHPSSGKGTTDWRVHYTPTPYGDIFAYLQQIDLRQSDVFTDLGCGLGRTVFAASWKGAKRSVGIEIVADLCARASGNHKHSRLAGRDIEFVCTHAAHYNLSETTVLFMFHPFGEDTLRQVVEGIKRVSSKTKEPLRIIYVNPVYDAVLERSSRFRCIGRVAQFRSWLSNSAHYETSLWRSI